MPKVVLTKDPWPGADTFSALVVAKCRRSRKTQEQLGGAANITSRTLRTRLSSDPGGWRLSELKAFCDEIGITLLDAVAILQRDPKY